MAWRDFDDPKNKNCRACKYTIYAGQKRVVCGFERSREMYEGDGRITVFDCEDWEVTTDNLKKQFRP